MRGKVIMTEASRRPIEFDGEQRAALDIAMARLDAGEQVTKIFGYAGTGKTTIAYQLARMLRDRGRRVTFGAYTGKAADVLTERLRREAERFNSVAGDHVFHDDERFVAQTIHSLIYRPTTDVGASIERVKAELERSPADLGLLNELDRLREIAANPRFEFADDRAEAVDVLILDEVSMVDDLIADDLLSMDRQIIVLGDPGQLPPVERLAGYFTRGGEAAADALLTTPHRFGNEDISDVARLATFVRINGRAPRWRDPKPDALVVPADQWISDTMTDHDQILVGTNKTRWAMNQTYRALTGMTGEILRPGERIIVLANNRPHEVLNGQQFEVEHVAEGTWTGTITVTTTCGRRFPVWETGFTDRASDQVIRDMPYRAMLRAVYATYAYAITVHKAQGSQWDDVLVIDQSRVFKGDAGRWLYTAVTRAAKRVKLITPV